MTGESPGGWAGLAGRAVACYRVDGGIRLLFDRSVDLGEIIHLVDGEMGRGLLAFSIDVERRGIGLEIRAPSGAADTVAALLGASAA